MDAKQINELALKKLANQEWKSAQDLLFENARLNPSHNTYSNLGYYLINEGIELENGKTKSPTY